MRSKRRQQLRKFKIVFGIGVIIVLLFVVFISSKAVSYDKVIGGEGITAVQVLTNAGNIEIIPYDGDKIRVQLTNKAGGKLSKGYKLSVKEKNNQVTIKAKKRSKFSQRFIVTVQLPNKQYETIRAQSEVANIDIGPLKASTFSLKAEVGNITTNHADGIIQATTEVGNVLLQFETITRDIAAKSEVGSVVVNVEQAPLMLQTNCRTSTGTTTINLPNVVDGAVGTGGPLVDLASEVGDVSLLFVGH